MEKRFAGSERHIDRLRRKGLSLEAPLLFSGITLLSLGIAAFLAIRRIIIPFSGLTVRCWGESEAGLVGCLSGVMDAGWIELGELLGVGSLVSLLFSWWVRRPRLQLHQLGIDGSRLSPLQWVERLKRAPVFFLGYSVALIGSGGIIFWVSQGDIVHGFLPATANDGMSLLVRAALGAAAVIGGVGAVSGGMGIWQFRQKTRMTDQEVRQEHRDDSGDPLVKGQQRNLHHAMLHEELVKAVQRSSVVFVSPTQRREVRG